VILRGLVGTVFLENAQAFLGFVTDTERRS
jgi:hypothetical protein